MLPKSISGKTVMMSSVGLEASKQVKLIVYLKIFTLKLLRTFYQNANTSLK